MSNDSFKIPENFQFPPEHISTLITQFAAGSLTVKDIYLFCKQQQNCNYTVEEISLIRYRELKYKYRGTDDDILLIALREHDMILAQAMVYWYKRAGGIPRIYLNLNRVLADGAKLGDVNIVKFMLNFDVGLSTIITSLRAAITRGFIDVVEVFLKDKRINIAELDFSPVQLAVVSNKPEVLKLLLSDPDYDPSTENLDLLTLASTRGYKEVVKVLLEDPRLDLKDLTVETKRVVPVDMLNYAWKVRDLTSIVMMLAQTPLTPDAFQEPVKLPVWWSNNSLTKYQIAETVLEDIDIVIPDGIQVFFYTPPEISTEIFKAPNLSRVGHLVWAYRMILEGGGDYWNQMVSSGAVSKILLKLL